MTYVYIQTSAVVGILTLVRQRKAHDVIIESQISPKKEVSLGVLVNIQWNSLPTLLSSK